MNNEERQVLNYLEKNAVGFKNKKTSDEIQIALKLPSGGKTNEHTRRLIRNLISNHNAVIGSDSKGYWIIETEQELQDVADGLKSRANEIHERAVTIQNNWSNKNE